jgi:hypothetical protein
VILGIDPGRHGAFALMSPTLGFCEAWLLDTGDPVEVVRVLRGIRDRYKTPIPVMLEAVHAGIFAGKTGFKAGAVSSFTFGSSFGVLKGALTALDFEFRLIYPRAWYLVAFKDAEVPKVPKERKRAVLERARERWPDAPLTRMKDQAVADAMFIAAAGTILPPAPRTRPTCRTSSVRTSTTASRGSTPGSS